MIVSKVTLLEKLVNKQYVKLASVITWGLCLLPAVGTAQPQQLQDQELSEVWGQAMFSVENTASSTFDLTKITLNADIKLNADFYNMQLGKPASATAALDIGALRFVSGINGTDPYVSIKDPYVQFVYKNQTSSSVSDREIVGLRFGFGEISGNLGIKLNSLVGNMRLIDQSGTNTGDLVLNSTTPATVFQSATGPIAMNLIGQIQANKSTDFFISMLTSAVSYGDGTSAPAGLSINWMTNLAYKNLTGAILTNVLPSLKIRQGG